MTALTRIEMAERELERLRVLESDARIRFYSLVERVHQQEEFIRRLKRERERVGNN